MNVYKRRRSTREPGSAAARLHLLTSRKGQTHRSQLENALAADELQGGVTERAAHHDRGRGKRSTKGYWKWMRAIDGTARAPPGVSGATLQQPACPRKGVAPVALASFAA
jgi:hypothetical protein